MLFAYQIKVKKLKCLTKMYNDTGLTVKLHGNAGKVIKNITVFADTEFDILILYFYTVFIFFLHFMFV